MLLVYLSLGEMNSYTNNTEYNELFKASVNQFTNFNKHIQIGGVNQTLGEIVMTGLVTK